MNLSRRTVMAGMLGGLMTPSLTLKGHAHDRQLEVAIRDFTFDPIDLVVHPTDQVTFTNFDLAPHTATALDGSWDTGELAQGQSITLTVTKEWTGDFFCAFHPNMTAKLLIEDH